MECLVIRNSNLLLPFFYLFSASLVMGQNPDIDSLKNRFRNKPDDTSKVIVYYAYGEKFERTNPDTAIWYYNRARELSVQINFTKGQAAYASHAIVILNNQGKFREALELCKEALGFYEKMGNKKELAVAYLNIGSEWQYLSDFQLASENYLMAKKFAEEIDDKRLQRITNNNLASIFINLKDYQKGKEYAEKSLVIANELKNDYAISASTVNVATAELYLKHYDNALARYNHVEQIGIRTDDYIVLLDGWLGIADVYNAMHNTAQAQKYYKQVIDFSNEKKAPEYGMYAYMGLSDLYLNTKQYNLAENTILHGIELAKELGSNYELKDLYLKASELKEKTGNFQRALDFRKKFEVLNDSVVGEKISSNVTLLEVKFESKKKESMIGQLESEKKIQQLMLRQKNIFNGVLIIITVSSLIISILFYRNYKQKQKLQQQRISELETENQLAATEAVMKGEEQERTRLAKDLHDGLGGMLSGIKYSFNTMKENLIMTPESHQAFERSIDMLDSSIKEMRKIAHNMMPESLVKFGLDTALKDFCNDITKSGALQINYQSIGLSGEIFEQTTAITIYRIVQELINNILKHAAAKTAIVQVTKTGGQLAVTVEDDGNGFDTTLLKQSKGIGWTNIQHRVEFLKGKIDVHSQVAKGTSVYIEFNVS